MLAACDAHGLALVPLVAPTTPAGAPRADRRPRAGVPVHGLGGGHHRGARGARRYASPRSSLAPRPPPTVPVALGFGISTPAQARQAAEAGADGVIVGSRLVRAAGESEDPAGAVGALVAELAAGLRG